MNIVLRGMFAVCLILPVVSCSENRDDEKYRSMHPVIADMTVESMTGNAALRTGDKILATVVQEKTGKLLYRADYSWTVTPVDGVDQMYKKQVIYDNEPVNPTDTLTFSEPGRYKLVFQGEFRVSGYAYSTHNGLYEFDDFEVTYSPSRTTFRIKVERDITVR